MRAALVVALGLVPAVAAANGRKPLTNGIHFGPGDTHSLYVASTFGLLVSHDDGCTFDWVCEDDIGYGGEFDPKYAIGSDGSIFAGTYKGLHVSRDGACSFSVVGSDLGSNDPANFSNVWVDAVTIGPTGQVWAGTADIGTNDMYRSQDGGHTFTPIADLASVQIWWKSVLVAPSDAQRVYITGYQVAGTLADGGSMPPTAHFLRSDDDGATWSPSSLAGVRYGSTPTVLVAAVDPTDADKLFLISSGAGSGGGDALYRSTDGGATFAEVLTTNAAAIRDVVIRDSDHVLVAALSDGGYASSDGGATFSKLAGTPQLACLGQRSDGKLFGCGENWPPDNKALSVSTDAMTWTSLFRFVNLAGPLACPAGTAEHDVCGAQQWPDLKTQFAATGPTCGITADGSGSAASDANVNPTAKSGGCCDAGGGGPASALLALGVGAVLVRRRRAPAKRTLA